MTDIVERLKAEGSPLSLEAADEIAKLRKEIETLRNAKRRPPDDFTLAWG